MTATITRQQALAGIEAGSMEYSGMTSGGYAWPDPPHYWIIKDYAAQTVHHVALEDDEPLTGCLSCGLIVEPEADGIGCGCHCPNCQSTL